MEAMMWTVDKGMGSIMYQWVWFTSGEIDGFVVWCKIFNIIWQLWTSTSFPSRDTQKKPRSQRNLLIHHEVDGAKLFFHILHVEPKILLICFLNPFTCFYTILRSWAHDFFKCKRVINNLLHDVISMISDLVSRSMCNSFSLSWRNCIRKRSWTFSNSFLVECRC